MRRFALKTLRLHLGVKQREFAHVLGIPQSCVSEMEHGKTAVSEAYVKKLKENYHITDIEQFYEEVEVVKIQNNRGNNNGYNNHYQSGLDSESMARIVSMEKDINQIKEEFKNKIDRLEKQNEDLRDQISSFIILCAQNHLDFSDIIKAKRI